MLMIWSTSWLAPLAYTLLRGAVAIILLVLAMRHLRHRASLASEVPVPLPIGRLVVWLLIIGELVIASLLLLGLYTQLAALALMAMCFDMTVSKRWLTHPSVPSRLFYTLLFFCALSLFITGAGALAVDLPI